MTDDKDRVYAAFLPRAGTSFERTEGKGSSATPLAETCPTCQRGGTVRYTGSDVLDGSLEMYHLIHTEVNDHFECGGCGHAWHELRFL